MFFNVKNQKFIKLKVRKDKSVNKAIGINEIKEYLEKIFESHDSNFIIIERNYVTKEYS